jgi:hypothetical protein
MDEEDWAAKGLAKMSEDGPLCKVVPASAELFHATKAIGAIEASNAILSLAALRERDGMADASFGQSDLFPADEYVSLTTSESRGKKYFDILVALAAIAENKCAPAQWLDWHLGRWGDAGNSDELLEAVSTEFDAPLAIALDSLDVETAFRPAADIRADTLAALCALSVVQQLEWLFALDAALMQRGNEDRGLSVVGAKPEAWSKVRLRDVALVKVRLSADAVGHLEESEEEVRVRRGIEAFEVVARGEERFSAWNWATKPG